MHDTHSDQNFEVIGLNTDEETVEEINIFAEDMKLNYPLVWADTKLQASLLNISKFQGIPQSFLIDRDGNLRGVFRGANAADIRIMEELVAKVVNE
jgi:peroxiredoxin